MRIWPFRRHAPSPSTEAQAHLAHARAQEVEVARVVSGTREIIRRNHLGPKIAAALRESPR